MAKCIAYIYKYNRLGVLAEKLKLKKTTIEFQKACFKISIPVSFYFL